MAKVGPSYWPAVDSMSSPDHTATFTEIQAIWAKTLKAELTDQCANQIERALRDYYATRGVQSQMGDGGPVREVLETVARHAAALLTLFMPGQGRKGDHGDNDADKVVSLALGRLESHPGLTGLVQTLIDLKTAAEREVARLKDLKRGPDRDFAFERLVQRLDRIAHGAGAKTTIFYKSEYDHDEIEDRQAYESPYLDFLIALLKPDKGRGAFAKSVQRAQKADIAETE